ncbi:hypothetical protein Nepgr_009371 [Nepenthes gracilis]|uniref:Uncharacterized protein n=1 Tax=Nepenthes gracilis TaxID=150966 RepID=A0AAD3XKB5_NEPGR|nr:hypothetical protein Nepgr_009371 [Nepenthes gracilis]
MAEYTGMAALEPSDVFGHSWISYSILLLLVMASADLHAVSYCDWFLPLMNSSGLLAGLDFGPILAGRHFRCRCWCFLLALDRWVRCSCPLLLDDGKLGVPFDWW